MSIERSLRRYHAPECLSIINFIDRINVHLKKLARSLSLHYIVAQKGNFSVLYVPLS